jgi:hypothetical protein
MERVIYIESDVPGEMTLIEWRRAQAPPKRRRRSLLRRAAGSR